MSAELIQLSTLQEEGAATSPEEVSPLPLRDAPDVMSPETLSRVLDNIAVATLAEWRTGKNQEARRGPVFHKLGGSIRYLKSDVVAWLDSKRVATSEQD